MPLASPDTTATPASASPRPSVDAMSRPDWVALRVPTTPTRRPSSVPRSPRTNSTAGGCGSCRSTAGKSGVALGQRPHADGVAPARPLRRAPPAGRCPPRRAHLRGEHRRHRVRRDGSPGGHGVGLVRLVVGEEQRGAGRTVIRSKPASAASRPDTVVDEVATPITPPAPARRRADRVRSDSATSTCSTSTSPGVAARRRRVEVGDRAGDAADAVVAAAGEAVALDLGAQQGAGGRASAVRARRGARRGARR